ncbi:hypothetical protein BST36_20810 [Mycolicibacterium moriokaense]|nr:hypothetical protein BST36_20810 [Mycolicibacterium moriokaense]
MNYDDVERLADEIAAAQQWAETIAPERLNGALAIFAGADVDAIRRFRENDPKGFRKMCLIAAMREETAGNTALADQLISLFRSAAA